MKVAEGVAWIYRILDSPDEQEHGDLRGPEGGVKQVAASQGEQEQRDVWLGSHCSKFSITGSQP